MVHRNGQATGGNVVIDQRQPTDGDAKPIPRSLEGYLRAAHDQAAGGRDVDGPKQVRLGRSIRYRLTDIEAYIAARVVSSTNEGRAVR